MSMEEFIRTIETNPSGQGGLSGGVGSPNELITHTRTRKIKQKDGSTTDETYVDVDAKTRLTSPTSFTVVEAYREFLDQTFGKANNILLQTFIERFKINMISKDGLSREEYTRILEGVKRQNSTEEESLINKISKM